jgi:hypothetical protein
MSDLTDTIADIENQLLRIEHNPASYLGGSKAYYSGYQTEYKPTIQRKVNTLTKRLESLYDKCEA